VRELGIGDKEDDLEDTGDKVDKDDLGDKKEITYFLFRVKS